MSAIGLHIIGRTAGLLKVSGIYAIVHLETSRCYVGSAASLKSRICYHRSKLRNSKHDNSHLQRAWSKYGEDAFVFMLLETCPVEELLRKESLWMMRTQCCDRRFGFNLDQIALRKMHSEETRAKIGNAHRGRKHPPEFGLKIRAAWAARTEPVARRTPEQKERHRKASTGRPVSIETRLKMSRIHKGKIITEEHRKKISETSKGRLQSKDTVRKRMESTKATKRKRKLERESCQLSLAI